MVKRWWWVAVAAVIVVGVAAYLMMGRSGAAGPSSASPAASGAATATAGQAGATTQSASSAGAASAAVASAVKVAASGSKLSTVTTPPTQTIAQIRYSAARNNQLFDVAFRVYGFGPPRGGHKTVVVNFTAFTAQIVKAEILRLKGNNALLQLGPGVTLTKGGTYAGVVQLTRQGADAFVFTLNSAKVK
jgi:hypothetical protein